MSKLLDQDLLTPQEVAKVLRTNNSVISASRGSGMLFGRPAPVHKKIGERKIMYSSDVISAWLDDIPDSRITDTPEPEGLRASREG